MRFHLIFADPPWPYKAPLKMSDGVKRASRDHYKTMTIQDIYNYPFSIIYEDDEEPVNIGSKFAHESILILCCTNPMLLQGEGQATCDAWGYEPKQLLTWVKGRAVEEKIIYRMGLGHYTRRSNRARNLSYTRAGDVVDTR